MNEEKSLLEEEFPTWNSRTSKYGSAKVIAIAPFRGKAAAGCYAIYRRRPTRPGRATRAFCVRIWERERA